MQAVVNKEFVHRFIKNREALGRRIQSRDRAYVIVGVVRNAVYESFGENTAPMLYFSYRDRPPRPSAKFISRTQPGGEMLLVSDVRRVLRQRDPTLTHTIPYDERAPGEECVSSQNPGADVCRVGTSTAAILAAIGIYAVVSYSVAQK